MVAVYNKDLLSWYLITLKLRETLQNAPNSIEGQSEPQSQLEKQQQLQQHQQIPLESSTLQQLVINGSPPKTPPQEPEWIVSIKEKLELASHDDVAGSWAKICIYRVPHFLRDQGDDKAYIPQVVSIGPYHRGRRRLQPMDRHKWRALNHMLKRKNQSINTYIDAMNEMEERARDCYEGPLNLTTTEFVEMMVLDGCFILEFFRGYAEGFENLGYERNDPIFATRGIMYSIRRDMMMIENQIPLFVLDKLLEVQLGADSIKMKGLIAELALIFFDPLSPIDEPLTAREKTKLETSLHSKAMSFFDPLSSDTPGLHCLDVFRMSLLRRGAEPSPRHWFKKRSRTNLVADQRRTQLIHCVMDLKESGIKFKKRKTDRFWDIKFKNGVFHIPRLLVHDGTKSLFLNLVAFEQCHLDSSNDITAYVVFMDNLINSAQDVSYLHYCGIIEHWLGNDTEVADMFNHLCQEVVFDINDSYLSKVSEEVNTYYNHRWNAWKASLKHKYFYNPWAIISFLAAVFLILLTSGQTFYSVFGYYKPPQTPN